ncbi:MAG TPA: SAM-dependent methyltransferase [Candidatus Anammoximicrobium sp.]|nr:SAM-dependent methyltransferase [Candidatus Anammoximicrobium sp.]
MLWRLLLRPCLWGAVAIVSAWGLLGLAPQPALAAEASTASTQLYLVGVGPGDPDLVTVRALKVMKQADVLFASDRIKEKFPAEFEGKEVFGGYWRLFPYYGQDVTQLEGEQRREAEALAVRRNEFIAKVRDAVKQGKTVAIVDSGDPLIYGPCAWCLEEFEDLHPVVVPGVSCFNAANAALRRGITNSENTKSVILTAADWMGKTDTIEKLSAQHTTMVLFTMRTEFKEFIDKLSINYPPDTPVAVVKHAGYAGQEEVVQATLGTILDRVGSDRLPFEYLIYVGDFLTHRYKKAR